MRHGQQQEHHQKNITLHLCNNFSIIILSHYACKMYSNYPGVKLVSAVWRQQENIAKICHHMVTSSQLQDGSFHIVKRMRMALK